MNWQQLEGKWDQYKGEIRNRWGKLTDDDLLQAQGRRDALIGRIKERYGQAKEDVEREVDRFIDKL